VTLLTDATFAVDARDAATGVWAWLSPLPGNANELVLGFPSGTT